MIAPAPSSLMTARTLLGALVWRARREGLGYLQPGAILLACIAGLQLALGLVTGPGGVNGAGALGDYARRFGVDTHAAQIGATLATVPGQFALILSITGALTVRALVGSEATRGAIEALLAAGYRPRAIVAAVLAFTELLVAVSWLCLALPVVAWVQLTLMVYGSHAYLNLAYVVVLLIVPLFAALSGTALAVTVAILAPRLTQQGQLGLAGGGGLESVVAVVPALAVLVVQLTVSSVSSAVLLGATIGGTALLLVVGIQLASSRFRVEGVL